MNIFVLDRNPVIAASYHCDQHLHKMILESAQMLSTAAHTQLVPSNPSLAKYLYAPAYQNHPCTVWVSASFANMAWVCAMAVELEVIRDSKGCSTHSSIHVVEAVYQNLPVLLPEPEDFAEAMYPHIKIRNDLTTVEKYQLYYRKKHQQWLLDKGRGMTYKDRPVPEFMKGLITS